MPRLWTYSVSLLVGVLLVAASSALADTVDFELGDSGWKLNGPSFYELNVNVNAEGRTVDGVKWVSLSISKNFRFGPNPLTGAYPAITLSFSQIDGVDADDLASRVIIETESVTNNTGDDWTDFNYLLYRHGVAQFNQELTNPTTDLFEPGWYVGPFSDYAWGQNDGQDTEVLALSDGLVVDDGSFYPGNNGAGGLVIDIDVDEDAPLPAIFKLAQAPVVPEPASMALMVLGGVTVLRRRRRA